jgi:Flp pilus assembly protein TadG
MSRRVASRVIRCSRGTTSVEFAVIGIAFLLVIFGTIEFSLAAWTNEALQETAMASARGVGLVQSPCGNSGTYSASMTLSYIENAAAAQSITLSSANVAVNNSTTCAGVSGFSQVTITYTFTAVVPLFLTSLSTGIPMTAVACFPNNAS